MKGDYSSIYDKYLNNKEVINSSMRYDVENVKYLILEKLISTLKDMLDHSEGYTEKNWQEKIYSIISFIFPKYIASVREVDLGKENGYDRCVDFLLVDSQGFIDLLEIKKPNIVPLLNKSKDRNNNTPSRIFTNAVMQMEKYLYTLSSNITLSKKIIDKILQSGDLTITPRVVNPIGLLILGRSNMMTAEQKGDFEIIKRQYKNVTEIITYDDLLSRMENMLRNLKKKNAN